MKAAVLHGAQDLRVEFVANAPAPGPGEVRLEVLLCGVCGTDTHEYERAPVFAPLLERHPASGHLGPLIIGHEFLGIVESRGPGVDGFEIGARVVAGAGVWCGECGPCLKGRTNLCERYFTHGLQIDGGLAEFVTVPAKMCVGVPAGCSDLDAVLAQPVAIAMHAVRRAKIEADESVAIIGAGAIGGLLIAALRTRRANITVFDIDENRLETARMLGAHRPVLEGRSAVSGADHYAGAFDAVFESSGNPSGLSMALRRARAGGRVIAVGLPSREITFDLRSAVVREVDVIVSSAHVCSVDLPDAIALLSSNAISKLVVDRVVDLEDIVKCGLEPLARRELAGKVIVSIAHRQGRSPAAPPAVPTEIP